MTPTDKLMLNRAAFTGDAHTMEQASNAMVALTSCLRNEGLTAFQRDGLLIALDIIAADLSERASFIKNEVLKEGD